MSPKYIGLLAIAGASVFQNPALGAESLMDIYQRAVQNDPVMRQAEATYLGTLETRPQAISQMLPSIGLSAGRTGSSQKDPNPATNFITGDPSRDVLSTKTERDSNNWSVSLNQTVFNWGAFVALKQADKIVARAGTDYEAAKQTLVVRVAGAYFDVLAAQDTLAAQVSAREATSRQLEQAQRRFEVGLIAITDVQEAQAGYDLSVATEIAAQQAVASAHETLRAVIGESVAELAGLGAELPLSTPQPNSPEEWVKTALDQNLALVSSRLTADIAQDSIDLQRAGRLPTLSFSTSYNQSSTDTRRTNFLADGSSLFSPSVSGPEGYSWSLNFNMPLFTGGLNASRIQQSVYQHRAAVEGLEQVARETERQTRDAYLGVLSEISRVRALRQAVESSRTALRATEAGFEVGTRTTVDVLTSQNNLSQAETTYARSRYDYILNVLRLKQAAGNLSISDVEEVDGWLME
jgi:outer membrane protein